MSKRKSYGFSFSWKRALRITGAKQSFVMKTGIPTIKQGLERKVGAAISGAFLGSLFGRINKFNL